MKILHTADWHIGKKLHKHDLSRDFDLFIKWLCETIRERQVELLLVSGDIFDLANPSSEARKQYYRALMELRQLNCRIILTGGNHDSPAMLDAPREILRELEMHVIGGLPQDIEEVIIPVKNQKNQVALVIAALPYLRDTDLRNATSGNTYEDRLETIRKAIQSTFKRAAAICETSYPGIPALAMGHLFAAGAETSESERDIQIGNQAAFNALQFGDYFNYIALGHIHKPQRVNAAVPTYYSGSPLPLSFSERSDQKRVLLLNSKEGWIPQSLDVPVFRNLLKISGTLDELELKLTQLGKHRQLDSLIELELKEEDYDATKIYQLDDMVTRFDLPGFEIVKHRASFKNRVQGAGDLYQEQQLEDLTPREVFQELITTHLYAEDTHSDILSAFDELLEEIRHYENPNHL